MSGLIFNPQSCQTPSLVAVRLRKPYHRPVLEALGDLRTMTLGASPTGIKDSGIGTLYEKNPDMPIPGFPLPDEFKQPGDPIIPPL
jgi:hypothetical protein